MRRLYAPTLGPTDWRRFLAKPESQWRRGKSAFELAIAWEAARTSARGLPPDVAQALDSHDATRGAKLLLGIAEHQVPLLGGGHASQNDLWALLGAAGGLISMTVEAKSGEPLDAPVGAWREAAKKGSGKPARLAHLRSELGLDASEDIDHIRYQLLHRAVSALHEAKRFGCAAAVLIVHSFGGHADRESLADFMAFAALLGSAPTINTLAQAERGAVPPLYIGWIDSAPASDQTVAAAV